MKIWSYGRVSTAAQADKGGSIISQREQCAGYAAMKGLGVPEFVADEGVTGSMRASQRPAAAKMLEKLEPGDHLIVAKLDRFFRSARDALNTVGELADKGINLHIIDVGGLVTGSEPIPKLILSILAALAEMELSRIKERIAEGKARGRAENKYMGGKPPYGWRPGADGILEHDPDQQLMLAELIRMHRDGRTVKKGCKKIAMELYDRHGITINKNTVNEQLHLLRKKYGVEPKAPARAEINEVLSAEAERELNAAAKSRPKFKYRQRAKRVKK
jgi:putative DNA-invertase from lambdoid prophage Rac